MSTFNSNSISATTVSATTLYSGSTNLSTLLTGIGGGGTQTFVQPGLNTTTGGTSSAPTINVIASPKFTNITSTGTTQFNNVVITGSTQFVNATGTNLTATGSVTVSNGNLKLSGLTNTSGLINFPFESGGTINTNRTININANTDAVYSLSGGGTAVTTSTSQIQMLGPDIVITPVQPYYVPNTTGNIPASYQPQGVLYLSGSQTYNTGFLIVQGIAFLTGGTQTNGLTSPSATITTLGSTNGFITNLNSDNSQIRGGNLSATTISAGTISASTYNAFSSDATLRVLGIATLSGGKVTVNTGKITANSKVFLTINSTGIGPSNGFCYEDIGLRNPGTNFTISSTNPTDGYDVAWFLVEPY